MANNLALIGAWSLQSFEIRLTDGTTKHPWGTDLVGQVMYSQDGYMSGTFMKKNRVNFQATDVMVGTPQEFENAMKSYVGYAGAYSVNGNRVIHHVAVSYFPNWSSTDIERYFVVEDNKLTLTTPSMILGGMQATSVGVWKRLPARSV